MSGGRYRVGPEQRDMALPWPVIDTHFGNETVARFRSRCLARECARAFNEPFFRPPVAAPVAPAGADGGGERA